MDLLTVGYYEPVGLTVVRTNVFSQSQTPPYQTCNRVSCAQRAILRWPHHQKRRVWTDEVYATGESAKKATAWKNLWFALFVIPGRDIFFVEPFQRAIIYFGGLWLMLGIYLTQALVVKISKLLESNSTVNPTLMFP